MAARVCEPIFPSSEPEEIPWRSSASCASKTVWTARGYPAAKATSGAFVLGWTGAVETITGAVGTFAMGRGLVLAAFHQSHASAAAMRMTNSQRKLFPE